MKNLRITEMAGLVCAFCMAIGLLSNADMINFPDDELREGEIAQARISGSPSLGEDGRTVTISADDYVGGSRSTKKVIVPEIELPSRQRANTETSRVSLTRDDVIDWINRNGKLAILEADRQGVPPGTSLSVAVLLLAEGRLHRQDDLLPVVKALAKARTLAEDRPARKRFKYQANSNQWFKGLEELGMYDAEQLHQVFKAYGLAAFDGEMYTLIDRRNQAERAELAAAGGAEQNEHRQPLDLDLNNEENRRSWGNAKNREAERLEEEMGTAVAFAPAATRNDREVSAARQEAEEMEVGRSYTFQDLRTFHSVLQEVLALEKGYDSWKEYRREDDRAKTVFRKRSCLPCNEMKMEIVRKR